LISLTSSLISLVWYLTSHQASTFLTTKPGSRRRSTSCCVSKPENLDFPLSAYCCHCEHWGVIIVVQLWLLPRVLGGIICWNNVIIFTENNVTMFTENNVFSYNFYREILIIFTEKFSLIISTEKFL